MDFFQAQIQELPLGGGAIPSFPSPPLHLPFLPLPLPFLLSPPFLAFPSPPLP